MAVAAVAWQGAKKADKTRIRARIAHVGSKYRRVLSFDACEPCIADWVVDARRLAAARDRTLIALAILELAEALDHASAIVDRLDGAYIHDDDWDEEGLPWLSWGREEGSYAER